MIGAASARRCRVASLPVALVVMAALLTSAAGAATFRTGQPVMGTVLQVTVVAADEARARELAEAAIAEARRWDDILTTWRPEGELARLNAHAGRGFISISPDLANALRRMVVLAAATDGSFDPGVGPLVAAWRGPQPPAPPPVASRATRIATALRLDGRRAALRAGASLDAGGVGKGMALDAMAARLRRRGAQAAFLDFGGSSQLALGGVPDAAGGWSVVVSGLAPDSVLGALLLRRAALSTSRATAGPDAAGPIIDPRSGAPIFTPRLGTVRAADATSAEAWSKAAIIAGRAAFPAARRHHVEMLIEDAQGVAMTAGFTLSR
ncbi:MAG: FAD:protein FMN transferase [bacterium]